MNKNPKTHRVGRDPQSGKFIPVKKAEREKDKVVERVPNPGYGDTKK